MAGFKVTVNSIFGGISASGYQAGKSQYHTAVGIDPEMPVDDTAIRASGFIRPTALAKFSGATMNGAPLWLLTNPKDTNIYAYLDNGNLISYTYLFASETQAAAVTSSSGNGAEYYDNYLYLAKNTDIARYGPLNGTPAITQAYWSSTLGLTALTDTTYPTINGQEIPNHPMKRHVDGNLYIGDVVGNKGVLHFVATTKTTVEGDTDNGSTYNALDFPYGYYPTTIETYGTDLAVGLIEGTSTNLRQSKAAISFWDTSSVSFNQIIQVELPDPIITALKNVNGVLYAFTGTSAGGYRILRFAGGYTFTEIYYSEEGHPPFQGAVDQDLNRLVWGTDITYPESAAVVMALGHRRAQLGALGISAYSPPPPVHCILRSTSAGSTQQVRSVKFIQNDAYPKLSPVVGWSDASSQGIDKLSTTYGTNYFRILANIGQPFQINKITIPLAQAVGSNMTVVPKLYFDNLSSNQAGTTINSTNYANSERLVRLYPGNFSSKVYGKHDFCFELKWSGSALLTVQLPITIEGEILDQ